jgi:hypothetical protein
MVRNVHEEFLVLIVINVAQGNDPFGGRRQWMRSWLKQIGIDTVGDDMEGCPD